MRGKSRLTRFCLAAWRPGVAALSVGCLLLGTLGFPVVRRKVAEGDTPYPCQHHACGCTSAEACWKGCCCFTPEEKLAWAARWGVTPPDYAVARATSTGGEDACCDKENTGTCGRHSHPPPVAKTSRPARPKNTSGGGPHDGGRITLAIGELARQCQGLPPWWAVLSAALPASSLEFTIRMEPVEWLRIESCAADSVSSLPAIPPPRALAA